MAAAMLCRRSLGRRALPLALGLSLCLGHSSFASRRQPLRLDALPPAPAALSAPKHEAESDDELIDPEFLKQVSGGSVSGFLAGLIVSVFSKTLVLLIGLSIVTIQVAARYGIDLVQQFHLKERVLSSRILAALRHNAPFKLSFGLTFALSAFAHF